MNNKTETEKINEKGAISIVSPILGFLLDHWVFFLFSGLLLSTYGEWKIMERYHADYIAEKAVAAQLTKNLDASNAALKNQNAQIEQQAKDAANKAAQVTALAKQLAAKDAADAKIINALKNKPSPATCQAVEADINAFIGTIKW